MIDLDKAMAKDSPHENHAVRHNLNMLYIMAGVLENTGRPTAAEELTEIANALRIELQAEEVIE